MTEFDQVCQTFTEAMVKAANWKQAYPGAVYTSRLIKALLEAREACNTLEAELGRLGEIR